METVRFGVIGTGSMGSHHVRYSNDLAGAKLAATCDVDPAKNEKMAKDFGVPTFTRYQDLLNSGLVDAVLIATPHYDHPPIAAAAFEKGIHVLSEKPIAVTIGAARKLNEQYAAALQKHPKLKFGIMFNQRCNAIYRKLKELVAEGELGDITRATWIVTDWFRTWAYYASGGWRATWAGEGGGVLLNQCPHNLDLMQWIVGMLPTRVTAVASIAKTHPIEVEDEVSAILEYPNGAIGHFVTTTGEAPGTNRFEICGDRGKIVAENGKLLFKRTRTSVASVREKSSAMFAKLDPWDIDIPYDTKFVDSHKAVTQAFIDAILKDTPLVVEGTEGVRGLEMGNAMLMAGLTRKPVDLPMDAAAYEAFLQDLIKTYGGKKTLGTKAATASDMGASFAKV